MVLYYKKILIIIHTKKNKIIHFKIKKILCEIKNEITIIIFFYFYTI